MPSRLKKAIGAVKDQTSISLAKVNSSTNLEVAILKATTHDDAPINERYVYEILQLVSSNKIYAAACARAIGKRITRTRNWIVALKSLMLVLRIFQDGDPYFPREVLHATKRGAKILSLSNFRDNSSCSSWAFAAFVRTFALYLDERLDCFLTGKLQRRYTHKEREGSHSFRKRTNDSVRDMKPSMLLDRIIYWQRLLERAIATRPTGAAKDNRLVQISLYAVVRESFDLYKDISDGLALLLDSFFHLQYQSCVSAFQICVKAAKQFNELAGFYSLCQTIGVGITSEYPTVQTIPEELIETLQEFLKDKSSFPLHTRSPSKRLVLPGTGLSSRRHESYGEQSQFSGFTTATERCSDKTSELGSRSTSLEELISATQTGKIPSISIDLEAYSGQFEKRSQREEPFRVSETGSTRSLPVTNSMVDLLSLDDWPAYEGQKEHQQQDSLETILVNELSQSSSANSPSQSTSSKDPWRSCSGKGWEFVLAESVTPSSRSQSTHSPSNNVGSSPNPQAENGFDPSFTYKESGSNDGWEVILSGIPTQRTDISPKTFNPSTALTSHSQPQPINHYNPFLQDLHDIPTVNPQSALGFGECFPGTDPFSRNTTFDWAQNKVNATNDPFTTQAVIDPFAAPGSHKENDPFATGMRGGDMFDGTVNQENLIRQQQLWLQNQTKIMARHMTNV